MQRLPSYDRLYALIQIKYVNDDESDGRFAASFTDEKVFRSIIKQVDPTYEKDDEGIIGIGDKFEIEGHLVEVTELQARYYPSMSDPSIGTNSHLYGDPEQPYNIALRIYVKQL
jgi:hypothetical protein